MPVIATPLPQRLRNTDRLELNRNSWQAGGLVGWWPLGAHPHATDKSLRGNGGTWYGDPMARSYGQRRGLDLDGSDYVLVSNNELHKPTTNFSVACWVLAEIKTSCCILSSMTQGNVSQPGFGLAGYAGSDQKFSFFPDGVVGGKALGGTVFSAGVWYHVVGTYDGSTSKVYLNGAVDGSTAYSGTPNATSQPIVFGRFYPNYDDWYLDGLLDDVRIYQRALGANEVAAIYHQTRDGGYGDLAAQPTRFHHLPVAAAVTGKGSRTAMFLGVE